MRRRRVGADELVAYTRRSREGPCFVCGIAGGDGSHEIVYEDDLSIAFLNRYPTQLGYTLVAPRAHRDQATGDFTEDEYSSFQRVIHRVAEALRRSVPTERIYVVSLGSQQANSHAHWHVVPLPPGVPYEEQQVAALDWERAGILELDPDEQAELAARIRANISPGGRPAG